MKVNYTLPGLLPEAAPAPLPETDSVVEPFGAYLNRLRAPDFTDWRELLRLNIPPAGATSIAPPPTPLGVDARDGVSQRAWWRGMLQKHTREEALAGTESDSHSSVQHMLTLLLESQQREDEVFARYFAEGRD
jgi:hypothetical protein